MDPAQYTATEWTDLARQLNPRQVRNSLKSAYRRTARRAVAIARAKLQSSGLHVQGDKADWPRGIRSRIYSRGGGFMVTVRGISSGRGRAERSMHKNRRYDKTGRRLPILMWAEDGTRPRYSGRGPWMYKWTGSQRYSTRHGSQYRLRRYRIRTGGIRRGAMPAYHFLEKATPQMYRTVEADLLKDVQAAVWKAARRAGFY